MNESEGEKPIYVVYTVNSAVNIGGQDDFVERDEAVVIGTRGPHRPLPPDTLLHNNGENSNDEIQANDSENYFNKQTPDNDRNVILANRPQFNEVIPDLQYPVQGSANPLVLREKPLLIPRDSVQDDEEEIVIEEMPFEKSDDSAETEDTSESSFNVISYLQDFLPFSKKSSSKSKSSSQQASTPLAYVYTPTPQTLENESNTPEEEKPVLLPSQQPSSSSSSAPSPQNFMAPFVASVSAEMPVRNGWNVVQVEGSNNTREEAQRRHDKPEEAILLRQDSVSLQNEGNGKFDPDNFKPQLFGGFKPIYEFPMDQEEEAIARGVLRSQENNQNRNFNK